MDITLAHLQIFNDYLCALSLYMSFSICLFYFLFAHLKDCGYLKEEVPNDRSSYRETIRHFQTAKFFGFRYANSYS